MMQTALKNTFSKIFQPLTKSSWCVSFTLGLCHQYLIDQVWPILVTITHCSVRRTNFWGTANKQDRLTKMLLILGKEVTKPITHWSSFTNIGSMNSFTAEVLCAKHLMSSMSDYLQYDLFFFFKVSNIDWVNHV